MSNLIKMDLHRMFKARSFKVCLILAVFFGFIGMPMLKLFTMLLRVIPGGGSIDAMVPQSVTLSSLLSNPFPVMNCFLLMLSACYFFYADMEHGYIKNIAGQMPKKGYTVLSKYFAVILHNLIFIAAGIAANTIGNVLFVKLEVDKDVLKTAGTLGVRFLLLMGLCAILLLVTSSLRSKTFGIVLSVVFGFQMMHLIYVSIDTAVLMGLKKTIAIEKYMPDELMWASAPKLIPALPVAVVTIAVFLLLAIRLFDHRDV